MSAEHIDEIRSSLEQLSGEKGTIIYFEEQGEEEVDHTLVSHAHTQSNTACRNLLSSHA